MKTIKILTLGALAASMSFAADAPSVTPVDQCRLALDNAKTNLPSNAYAAKLTLAEGYGTLNALETIYADDKNSKLIPTFLENCQKYAEIAKLQGETQAIQNHIAENWEKRAATNRTIEAIQEQIGEARSGKVSDLEAEKQAARAERPAAETTSVNRREERRLEAQERARKAALKKPFQKKLDAVEKELQSVRADLDAMDARIADAGWYQSTPQDEVSETMRRRGELASRCDELEMSWLEISEEIEAIG